MKPRLLDLFCGAGGAGMGYHRAGFEVVGVDIAPQPHYPFEFHQGDALEYLAAHGHEFDAIHASPPCQRYSSIQRITKNKHKWPDLVDPVRQLLIKSGKPYVIENVQGAPLRVDAFMCGSMFGLGMIRHRIF
jgi:site-specific DNA-cytosine methylase